MEAHLPVLVIVVPLMTALVIPFLGRLWRGSAPLLVGGALGFSVWGAWQLMGRLADTGSPLRYAMGDWDAPTGIEYVVDPLNAMVIFMVAVLGVLCTLWMRKGLALDIPRSGHVGVYAVFLLFATGLMGIAITGDVFNLYVFLEIASITSYVLIGLGRKRQALMSGFSYLIVGSLGATFILLGIGYLYQATGTLAMADLAERLPALYDDSRVRTSYAFLTVGLAVKMALFPLHGWQPSAYRHAPAAMSIFLAATATKISAYVLYRVTFSVFGVAFLTDALPILRDIILVMAACAIVTGPLLAIRQTDLKRLLAYSSVGQIGYIVLGIALLNEDGAAGGIAHFWNHAAAKGALFCVAGALVYGAGTSSVSALRGLGRRAPWTATTVTLGGLSMIGVPLTAGFQSKLLLAQGGLASGRWIVVVVLIVSSLLTAVYVWRICMLVWFADREQAPAVSREVPWSMRLPGLALAAACIVLGVTPWGVQWAQHAAEVLLP